MLLANAAAATTTTVDDNDDNALKFHPQQVGYFFLANTTESFGCLFLSIHSTASTQKRETQKRVPVRVTVQLDVTFLTKYWVTN